MVTLSPFYLSQCGDHPWCIVLTLKTNTYLRTYREIGSERLDQRKASRSSGRHLDTQTLKYHILGHPSFSH